MTRFHFERADGFPSENVQNLSRHLNQFIPPQGYSGTGVPTQNTVIFAPSGNGRIFSPSGNRMVFS